MNTLRVVNRLGLRKLSSTFNSSARQIQTMVPVNSALEVTPPWHGMLNAWQSLQQQNWVTTQSYDEPEMFDTINTMAETKSILGTRHLGLFEEIPKYEKTESIVRPKQGHLRFNLRGFGYSEELLKEKPSFVGLG